MEQWSDGHSDGMARSSGWLTGNQNLRRVKSSESALNSGIPVYSVFTHTSDFVQTQNEAKILTHGRLTEQCVSLRQLIGKFIEIGKLVRFLVNERNQQERDQYPRPRREEDRNDRRNYQPRREER
jgi:hypothetical protein